MVSCPIASVFAPPAVIVIAPSEAMVPAKVPAVPEAVEVTLLKFGAAPTDTAEAVSYTHLTLPTILLV